MVYPEKSAKFIFTSDAIQKMKIESLIKMTRFETGEILHVITGKRFKNIMNSDVELTQ